VHKGLTGEKIMSQVRVPVLTIDGPSGSGKGTVAKLVAEHLSWHLLDSGALYRLTALACQRHGVDASQESAVEKVAKHLDAQFIPDVEETQVLLESENVTKTIRTEEVGEVASIVAAYTSVREALLQRQRDFRQMPGLVADGRDMGTDIFPDAGVKIFLTASVEERAKRRYLQLKGQGKDASLAELVVALAARDERDANRKIAPLMPANGALVVDSTRMSIPQAVEIVLEEARKAGLLM
jgi:cytidylate kinase